MGGCCCGCGSKKEKKGRYECPACGKTSATQDTCCGKKMKDTACA